MPKSIVKWFRQDKGYGFILDPYGGRDLFVHVSQIDGDGPCTLDEGETVSFDIERGRKGRRATNVRKTAETAETPRRPEAPRSQPAGR